ncbi:uncharacterized protein LOC117181211 [Belonocnema kinseyi]|uniref:uncharacterized protein LOC117181211 n=1 Tax=Belonocnema kinseyi TaxID=2817044 RepID=UPI00143CEAEE|nr:uncharacterized protein LOC117181211 [Belonocnema kinseyi]
MKNIRETLSNLIISHWNINGIAGKCSELKQYVQDRRLHIMMLNETKLNSERNIKITNFKCIRKDRNERGTSGGVMIYVREGIRCHEVPLDTKIIEAVAIKLENNLVIVSAYKAPGNKLDSRDLNLIFQTGSKVFMYGDFNVKSTAWNCRFTNTRNSTIFDFAENYLCEIHYPDNFTSYPYNSTFPSTVDTDISKNIVCDITVDAINEFDSDHLPVILSMSISTAKLEMEIRTFPNYKKANWGLFRKLINKNLTLSRSIKTQADLDRSVNDLVSVIHNAMEKSIPRNSC